MASLSDVRVKRKISCQYNVNVWLSMMTGHGTNPIFFHKKIKIGRPERSLTPHPPTFDNISFLPKYRIQCCFSLFNSGEKTFNSIEKNNIRIGTCLFFVNWLSVLCEMQLLLILVVMTVLLYHFSKMILKMFVSMKIYRRESLWQQFIKYLNNLTYLISSEETLTESIKAVKEMIEKINSIDMNGRLIEKPKISKTKALSFNQ